MSTPLTRISGALSGQYRLEAEIGAGGMATVYLADDVRHDRKVAVKVLRPELAAVIGAERFLAEIKLTANLQHPHILPLFDSGEAESFLYYVMPYVEGESLRDRLSREKQLPVDEAVRLACEVASALDYAHRHGVVHRDIKPENILLHDGRALVADFGIALAASKAGGARMTETGMSLGTPHYMSPEQAMGEREITARSDIYALGAVLYEMLTGDPPFTGSTAQAVVARVVTEAPRPLIPQRHTIPPHVEAAVLTALEKLPADRFATAAQLAEALTHPAATRPMASTGARHGPMATGQARPRWKDPVVVGLAIVTAASLGFGLTQLRRPAAEAPLRPVRFLFTGSDSARVTNNIPWPAAISPDGGTLVYAVAGPDGSRTLYARRTDQLEGQPIAGTLRALQPLFSPDGQWLAFEAEGQEKRVRLDGSAPATIAAGGSANGADWTTNDELILGSTDKMHGLSRVNVAGGEPVEFTRPDSSKGELDHLWPIAFPDGRAVVFTIWTGALATARLAIAPLDGGAISPLGLKGIRPLAVLDGTLVYLQADGAVMGVALDPSRKGVTGRPIPVLDPVTVIAANNGNSSVFISRGGALVTGIGTHRAQLMWVGRDGVSRPISREVRDFSQPRLSPDGRRIAVIVSDGSKSDVWIHDLETGTLSRLTTSETVTSVEWTRDGTKVVYSASGSESRAAVWAQSVDAASAPEMLIGLPGLSPVADISPDRHWLLLQSLIESWDVLKVPLDSAHIATGFVTSKSQDLAPRFSPDGHWVALTGDESGASEAYVRSFPEATVKTQVSVGGAGGPLWSADGTRLYYVSGTAIMQARLATGATVRVLSRDTAFAHVPSGAGIFGQPNFDVSRDGSRIVTPVAQSETYRLVVVPNWLTEFRQRMAASRR
jgi:Tol biopolymer transport system component/tRNA A-37 threonylcarbamoyl transferase component Bud32